MVVPGWNEGCGGAPGGGGEGSGVHRQLDSLPGCASTDYTQLGPHPREDTGRWLPLSQELCNPSKGPDTGVGGALDVGRPHRLQAQKTIPATRSPGRCPRCLPRSPARCGQGRATARAQQLCPWLHTLLQASRPRRGAPGSSERAVVRGRSGRGAGRRFRGGSSPACSPYCPDLPGVWRLQGSDLLTNGLRQSQGLCLALHASWLRPPQNPSLGHGAVGPTAQTTVLEPVC